MSLTQEIGSWIASPFASKLIDRAYSCMSAEGHKAEVLLNLRSLNNELQKAHVQLAPIDLDDYKCAKALAAEKCIVELKHAAGMAEDLVDGFSREVPGARSSWSLLRAYRRDDEVGFSQISIGHINEALNRLREANDVLRMQLLIRAVEVEGEAKDDVTTPLLRRRMGDIKGGLAEIKMEIDKDMKKKRPRESLEDLLGVIKVNIKNVKEQINRLLGPLSSTSTSSTSFAMQTDNNLLEVPSLSPSKPIP